jgi:hypothetical protein
MMPSRDTTMDKLTRRELDSQIAPLISVIGERVAKAPRLEPEDNGEGKHVRKVLD